MQDDIIRMLRYNTGTDKKAFIAFKNNFDAVIFNATIVAYSGSAIADLVSVYKNQYIIDPMTHIMQHDIMALMSKDKKTGKYSIKKSVINYLKLLPNKIMSIIETEQRPLSTAEIEDVMDELIIKVYNFETGYVDTFIKEKEYDKYLKYANIGPQPKVIIAPYFMLKKDMDIEEIKQYFILNKKSLDKFASHSETQSKSYEVAAQLVIDREILKYPYLLDLIKDTYNSMKYEYVFIWINDFSTFDCSKEEKEVFYHLIKDLNNLGKKPLMAYGGYDAILLSHRQMKARLYGTAQSVGYGEARPITPVGGGLPVNKYYFGPLHRRMRFDEALNILMKAGYFSSERSNAEHALDYYQNICKCAQCKEIIQDDIDNFKAYNESIPYTVNARYGEIKRNRPTTEATLIAAFHFLYCKIDEWDQLEKIELSDLVETLIGNYSKYGFGNEIMNIKEWCEIFA